MSTEENTEEQKIEDPAMGFENLQVCLNAIMAGQFDGRFDKIVEAMDERREARKTAVMNQVREVFGPDAVVQLSVPPDMDDPSESTPDARPIETNPFLKKQAAEDDDEPSITDTLDSLPVNQVEREMIEQGKVESLPIEHRGAIIGGLTSSDMGE